MNMLPDFHARTDAQEIMDDLEMEGDLLEKTLDQLAWINVWLGGNLITWEGIRKICKKLPNKHLVIGDLGTGGGDALRYLAKKTKRCTVQFQFIGLDANEATLAYATKLSVPYPNISYRKENILDPKTSFKGIDVVTCALFLHHFKNEEIIELIKRCKEDGVKFLLINDLQRHKLPYILFFIVSKILHFTNMAHHDGLISVRRGFKRQELQQLLQACKSSDISIKWRWAFRYLLIADLRDEYNRHDDAHDIV